MKVTETSLAECLLIEPKVYGDARGWFMEAWNRERYAELGIGPEFVQANLSRSARGVLRGLHYQWPNPQGKLISVLEGEVFDVAVDIRRGSPTFGQWAGALLSAETQCQFWVPKGFAHGFVALSESVLISYLCTAPYDAAADASVAWNDPSIGIEWPVDDPSLSAKDAAAALLREVAGDRLPIFAGTG